jgi:hypothetical protein
LVWVGLAALGVLAIAVIVLLVAVVPPGAREAVRDVAIIILAIETIAIGLGIGAVVFVTWRLIVAVQRQVERLSGISADILTNVKEIAQTTTQTAKTAQGTATFISDRTARPLIDLYSAVNGASRFARAFFRSRQPGNEGDRS